MNEGSEFKYDCVQYENYSYTLVIGIISFKLCLINFVNFFDTQKLRIVLKQSKF